MTKDKKTGNETITDAALGANKERSVTYETTFCTSVNSYLFYTKMLLWNKLALNYFSKYDPSIQKTINFILIDKKKCEEFIKKNQSAYEVD